MGRIRRSIRVEVGEALIPGKRCWLKVLVDVNGERMRSVQRVFRRYGSCAAAQLLVLRLRSGIMRVRLRARPSNGVEATGCNADISSTAQKHMHLLHGHLTVDTGVHLTPLVVPIVEPRS